jgi:hypothetical protein
MNTNKTLKLILSTIKPDTRSEAYSIVRDVVKAWGHWKGKPRGKPRKFEKEKKDG